MARDPSRGGLSGPCGTFVFLAVLLALGAWPFVAFLDTWPTSRDATIWIARGAPASADWLQWDLATRHFNVGYRPVTALSYTLDHLAGGFSAWPYRVTDLALHLACGLFVYFVYRRFAPTLPRWGGLVAAGLFLAHPVTEEVVPHLARRSYSLAALCSLIALYLLCPRASAESSKIRSLIGGLFLAGAVLSNEVALVTVAIVPLLLYDRLTGGAHRWRRLISICALPAFLVVLALVARLVVVGGVGGYADRPDRLARAVPIALATGRAVGAISPAPAGEAGGTPVAAVIIGALVAVYYVLRSIAGWFRDGSENAARLGGHLLIWVAGYTALFASLGVWFPRQVYVVLIPFALLAAVLLAQTTGRHGTDRRLLAAHLVPQVLLLGWILIHSPVIRGVDPVLRASWQGTDLLLRDMHQTLQGLPGPASVRTVVPHYTRPRVHAFRARDRTDQPPLGSRQPAMWMNALLAGRETTVESLAIFERDPLAEGPTAEYVDSEGIPAVALRLGTPVHLLGPGVRKLQSSTGELLQLEAVAGSTGTAYLYFHDGEQGRMIELEGATAVPSSDAAGVKR